ncbi:DNA adenine methylase [Lacticaseibacillus rhamnosus]|uniref:DNA adenine methylase n=1 Tax=Lacticaseibacillus rhamnosus TaxID=47715 RepID=UPI001CDAF656|nr:Dam family site-specific DNA-(adenine-N6)-methyltransferase [Lacticaseibacillus rhamnosus]
MVQKKGQIRMGLLPRKIAHVQVPPIKIQGIKTKLVPFIANSISWEGTGVWYEPFMGSGVVGFNIAPQKAVFSDNNPYIIKFYQDLKDNKIDSQMVRSFLSDQGEKLSKTPKGKESYYYFVRKRFNQTHTSLDFLFLQRSNFNGMVRFGPNGYNVPFGRKPDRFRPALITKIANQVDWVQYQIHTHDWEFKCQDWKAALSKVSKEDFVYLDPPYIGRHTEYFDSWGEDDANQLADYANNHIAGGYALSMWYKNKYRENNHLQRWHGHLTTNEHFYFLGGKQFNRGSMTEALVTKNGFQARENNMSLII